MGRTLAIVAASLTFGALAMYGWSHFRIRVESIETSSSPVVAAVPDSPRSADPPKLPDSVVQAGFVVPVMTGEPAPAPTVAGLGTPTAGTPKAEEPKKDPPPKPRAFRIVRIDDDTVKWSMARGLTIPGRVSLISTNDPVLVLDRPIVGAVEELRVSVNEQPFLDVATTNKVLVKKADAQYTVRFAELEALGFDRSVTLSLRVQALGTETIANGEATITLMRPRTVAVSDPRPILLDEIANSPFLPPVKITNPATETSIYGAYVRLLGKRPASGLAGEIRMVGIHKPSLEAFEIPSQARVDAATWDHELKLQEYANNTGLTLHARLDTPDGHFYTSGVPVLVQSQVATLEAPTIQIAPARKAEDLSSREMTVYRTNTRAQTVTIDLPAGAQEVLLTVDNESPQRPKSGREYAIVLGPGRDHVLRAVPVRGSLQGTSTQVELRVRTTGPVVESVIAPGFGSTSGATDRVQIRFGIDNPLEPDRARNPANYTAKHQQGSHDGTIAFAEFDAVTNTVTLGITGIVPGTYKIGIRGEKATAPADGTKPTEPAATGLIDVYGNAMSGPAGLLAGGQVFETVLATQRLEEVPSQSVGISLQTGPNVTFPEYTKFRPLEDGFNPSDKVETRVVRLYYNRDANRVAQIVNRDVKSYNVATSDIRRRAADRSRDDANRVTDERQRLERAAIQAATEARAAEAELQSLQGRQTTSRVELVEAQSQIRQKELELEQARRDLEQARIAAATRAATDPGADVAIRRLESLESQIAELEADIASLKSALAAAKLTQDEKRKAEELLKQKQLELIDKTADLAKARQQVGRSVDENDSVQSQEKKTTEARTAYDAAYRVWKQATDGTTAKDLALVELNKAEANLANQTVVLDQLRRETRSNVEREKVDPAQQAITNVEREIARQRQIIDSTTVSLAERQQAEAEIRRLNLVKAQAQRDQDRALATLRGRSASETATLTNPIQQRIERLESDLRTLRQIATTAESVQRASADAIASARNRLQNAREAEVRSNESSIAKTAEELRRREDQYRTEVSAATTDPDIYVPGKPDSLDPVRQCSLAVIGEGLIQIRGPIKGLNVIRTMINQLDAPVGQVRLAVHTIQVNGERGERMEKVVANIQRYIDHARFLTDQSGQMLRKSVTLVASRKAEEAAAMMGQQCTQAERDQKYLYAFFGKDFIGELYTIDSEFLKTGNKLLSLHSMDSTSLSAALFLLALAKNSVRMEILATFQAMLQRELPQAELNYYQAGLNSKCEACFDRKQYLLSYNARFQSFLGHFNAEVAGDDTMTPLQREFVRLAQIFKSRMVTELQLKQRVMERSLLEERVGNYLNELRDAKERDDESRKAVLAIQSKLQDAFADASVVLPQVIDSLQQALDDVNSSSIRLGTYLDWVLSDTPQNEQVLGGRKFKLTTFGAEIRSGVKQPVINLSEVDNKPLRDAIDQLQDYLNEFYYISGANYEMYKNVSYLIDQVKAKNDLNPGQAKQLQEYIRGLIALIQSESRSARQATQALLALIRDKNTDPMKIVTGYNSFREDILSKLRKGKGFYTVAERQFRRAQPSMNALSSALIEYQSTIRKSELSRRPLDEKKLLDLLVDEVEDKYIEMLEGTRAHTANIDNYLKNLSSALEADFNTQFYHPSMRRVREASRSWDVSLGQIETTTVLTNNRTFAKVSPAATMEFDLPKREIFITEGFKAAKAVFDEYGALVNDPAFLALAKLYSGQPLTGQVGAGGVFSPVRNVLPGLPTSPDEMMMSQVGPGRKEFGTSMEALIPDPAIYKFETGTGYEIRPVLSPDGQNVVFNFNYMYTTNIREPVRADEKHLGRVNRHFITTDVQLSNYEMREVSKYQVALKAARTSRGVQLLQDIPGVGVLFRPLPSAESSLQQNLIYAQSAIFPTLYDLMGLRYAPAIADLDPNAYRNDEWVVRSRRRDLEQRIYDYGAARVDEALRIPHAERRPDLYRPQETIPNKHPNGYDGPGLRLRDSHLIEGVPQPYDPRRQFPETPFTPRTPPDRSRDPLFGPHGYSPPGDIALPPAYVPTPIPALPVTPSVPLGVPSSAQPPGLTLPVPRSAPPMVPSMPSGAVPAPGVLPPSSTTVRPASVPR